MQSWIVSIITSLQCRTILQKSLQYADLLLKKHFLLSILKTVKNIFQDSYSK